MTAAIRSGHQIIHSIERLAPKKCPRVALLAVQQGDGATTVLRQVLEAARSAKRAVALLDLAGTGAQRFEGMNMRVADLRQRIASGIDEVIEPPKEGGVVVGDAHPSGETERANLETRHIRRLADMFGERFDFVLIDAPAVFGSAMAETIAQTADLVYLIVRQDATVQHQLLNAVDRLERIGIRPAGIIYNERTRPIPEFIYRTFFGGGRRAS